MKLVFLDTETIDFINNVEYDVLFQLSYLVIDTESPRDFELHDVYCQPEHYTKMTPGTMSVTGIVPEFLADKPTIYQTKEYSRFQELIQDDAVFIAHNMDFDKEVLRRVGLDLSQSRTICTYDISTFINDKMQFPYAENRLGYLKYYFRLDLQRPAIDEFFGITSDAYHNSLSDIADLILIYNKEKEVLSATDQDLVQLCSTPLFLKHLPFGKDKGKPLSELSNNQVEYYKSIGNKHLSFTFQKMGW